MTQNAENQKIERPYLRLPTHVLSLFALLCLAACLPITIASISDALGLRSDSLFNVPGGILQLMAVFVMVFIPMQLSRWASASRWLPALLIIMIAYLSVFVIIPLFHKDSGFLFSGISNFFTAVGFLSMLLTYGATMARDLQGPKKRWEILLLLCYLLSGVVAAGITGVFLFVS